jgi:hypothetical protein
MKLINKDGSFFNYLTKFKKSDENTQKNQFESNEPDHNVEETKFSLKENNIKNNTGGRLSKIKNQSKEDFFDFQHTPQKSEEYSKSPSPSRYIGPSPSHPFGRKNSFNNTKNSKAYTSKDIREILDNYNELYKIKKIPKESIENGNTTNKEKQIILPSLINNTENSTRGYSMIENLNSTQKSQLFKSTIYNSMLPVRPNKISSENKNVTQGSYEKTNKKNTKSKTEYGPFLNFNYEEFNRKIEITNPEVKKLLEDLNYFGPHFSHCPSCRNKNLEFYETLEPSQCIKILQFIKKCKKKNKINNNK